MAKIITIASARRMRIVAIQEAEDLEIEKMIKDLVEHENPDQPKDDPNMTCALPGSGVGLEIEVVKELSGLEIVVKKELCYVRARNTDTHEVVFEAYISTGILGPSSITIFRFGAWVEVLQSSYASMVNRRDNSDALSIMNRFKPLKEDR